MKDKIVNILATYLIKYPNLRLVARSIYLGMGIAHYTKLVCYAKGKSYWNKEKYLVNTKDQVLVKAKVTALNTGTERANFLQLENTKLDFPYNPQASGMGIIVRKGWNVKGFKKGQRVFGPFNHAELSVLSPTQMGKVHDRISDEQAGYLHLGIIAMQGVRMLLANWDGNGKVLVYGQGIIGRFATLILRAMEYQVVCVTNSENKLKKFKEDDGIAMSSIGAQEKLTTLACTAIIDATGAPELLNKIIETAGKTAAIVLLGSNRGLTNKFSFGGIFREKRLKLVGAHIRNLTQMPSTIGKTYQQEGEFLQELILAGKLNLDFLTSKKIQANELSVFYNDDLTYTSSTGILVDWTKFIYRVMKDKIEHFEYPEPKGNYRVALIGCGDIGLINAKAIAESKSMSLSFVVDKNISLARKLGEKYGVEYDSDYRTIKDRIDIDIVIIALPHFLHEIIAKEVASFGRHIVIEKPIAMNVSEGRNMIEAALENKILLKTYYPFIYDNEVLLAHNLVKADCIGEIYGVSMAFQRERPKSYWFDSKSGKQELSWRGQKALSGGGFLLMYLVHGLNNLKFITGLKVESIFANLATAHHPIEVEDTAAVTFKASNGAIGSVSTSSAVRGQGGSIMRIWGANGQIIIDNGLVSFYSLKRIGEFSAERWHKIKSNIHDFNSRSIFLDQFAIDLDQKQIADYNEDGLSSLSIIEAAYHSAKENKPQLVNYDFGTLNYEKSDSIRRLVT